MLTVSKRDEALEALRKEKEQLEQLNRVMMDREQRVLEMKQEVNELLSALNTPPKYG